MIIEKEFRKLVHQLVRQEVAKITLGHSEVIVHVLDNASKVSLSSLVYSGGNFIPKSVRECLNNIKLLESEHIKTYLNVDEETFSITLNFLGGLQHLNKRMFVDLLEEFSWLADEWRLYLDEHDRNDLIHIHIPK
ncbi:MAG: hypothetical protein WCF65_03750 [Parachlamydiaceae bacterium]